MADDGRRHASDDGRRAPRAGSGVLPIRGVEDVLIDVRLDQPATTETATFACTSGCRRTSTL